MCNRYSISKREADLQTRFGAVQAELSPRYNIAPTQSAPVARVVEGVLKLEEMRWGFEGFNGQPLTNARSETAHEKPTFREAWPDHHCIVPSDGFFEWKDTPEGKQPYRFILKSRELFWFAGLWSNDTFTLLTGQAQGWLTEFHNRMPMILVPEAIDGWLENQVRAPEWVAEHAMPVELLESYTVTPRMSNSRFTGEECIQPFQPPQREFNLG